MSRLPTYKRTSKEVVMVVKSFKELRKFRSQFPPRTVPVRSAEELIADALRATINQAPPKGWGSTYERFPRDLPNSRLRNRLLAS